jgi:hypothetical protein
MTSTFDGAHRILEGRVRGSGLLEPTGSVHAATKDVGGSDRPSIGSLQFFFKQFLHMDVVDLAAERAAN